LDSASSALAAIRKRRRNVRTSIYDTLQKRMGEVATMLSDTIVTERNDRYVIPVKQGSEKFVPGMVQGRSGSKATVFVEPAEVVGLNNELKTLSDDEHEEILRILTEFTDQLREQTNAILANQNELGGWTTFCRGPAGQPARRHGSAHCAGGPAAPGAGAAPAAHFAEGRAQ
jgi:DNA mismatch repair protein MutS2